MSQSSEGTSENSQHEPSSESLSSGEKELVRAGVQVDAPSPPRPAQPESADPAAEAGLEPEPERFEPGKLYTPKQIAEARC